MANKRIILLTGAGFTKNFGGLLADEIWAMMFNHKEVQDSVIIRGNMLSEFNYETVYQYVVDDNKLDENDKVATRKALLSAYEYQENIWLDQDFSLNIMDEKILNHLCGFISKYVDLYFTLNHDLFVERKLLGKFRERNLYLLGNPSDMGRSNGILPDEAAMLLTNPIIDKQLSTESGISYIKLHGSMNWLGSIRKETLVIIGGNKKEKMKSEPLLRRYYELFKQTLLTPDQRLLIIGYGFMDNHINDAILEGLMKKLLKLHIIDVLSPEAFRNKMAQSSNNMGKITKITKEQRKSAETREMIWLNMSGYFPVKSIEDLFTSNGTTPLYKKLIENLELNSWVRHTPLT
jgi:hypothetical protein